MNNLVFMYGFMTGVAASFVFIFVVLTFLVKGNERKNNTALDENK